MWTKAMDIGLAAAVFLSLPMTWTMDQMVQRAQPTILVSGKIFEDQSRIILAMLNSDEFDFDKVAQADFLANFNFKIDMKRRGWPFVTSVYSVKPLLNMDIFSNGQGTQAVDLEIDSPQRIAISRAMINAGFTNEVAIWDGDLSPANNNLATWAANIILWTIILLITSWISINITRFAYIFISTGQFSKKQSRLDSGLCAECGYDLRGNQFGERCPECGVLTG